MVDSNNVELSGKVSGRTPVKYTAAGTAIVEFTLAVNQEFLDQKTNGYFTVTLSGEKALLESEKLRIGKSVSVVGTLWTRQYRDRRGNKLSETKVVAKEITC